MIIRQDGFWKTIFHAPGASTASIAEADWLATRLEKVAGPAITRQQADGTPGIWVGLLSEWIPAGYIGIMEPPSWTFEDWDFTIRDHWGSLVILGRDERHLKIATRRFLHKIGYTALSPAAGWEIFPTVGDEFSLEIVHQQKVPKFIKGLGEGCGLMIDQVTRLNAWRDLMGLIDDGVWQTGHAWGRLILDRAAEFSAHPEWRAGTGAGNKLCVLSDGLPEIASTWAQTFVKENVRAISMAASDGSTGWTDVCVTTNEQSTLSPSDRQITLANHVQHVIGDDVHVAVQAYGNCSLPPDVTLDPRLLVIWMTGYVFGGLSPEAVRDGYIAKGAINHSPYSYLSVYTWDHDLPGIARASDPAQISVEIARAQGALGYSCEASPSWLPYGRFYWALANGLIEPGSDLWAEYPRLAFPHGAIEAESVYNILSEKKPLTTDLIHRLAEASLNLIEACKLYPDELTRALDVGSYAIYCDFRREYEIAPNATTLEALLQWSYRIRDREIVTYRCPYYDPTLAKDRQAIAVKYGLTDLNPHQPVWTDPAPTESDIRNQLVFVITNNALLPFTPVGFSGELQKTSLISDPRPRGSYVYMLNSSTWTLSPATSTFTFDASAGIAFSTKGPARIEFWDRRTGELAGLVTVPEDKVRRSYSVNLDPNNLYNVTIHPGGGVDIDWIDSAMTYTTREGKPPFAAAYTMYFYVPKGTTTLGGYSDAQNVKFYSPDGTLVYTTPARGYFAISLSPIHQGKFFKVQNANGILALMTVPPQIALHPTELLLPADVVSADDL
jgi:hypothetical protein